MRAALPLALATCLVSNGIWGQSSPPQAPGVRRGATHTGTAELGKARGAGDRGAGDQGAGSRGQLPVTHVSLYKNGVGFFEHATRVTGDGTVTLDLTSAQLNDALATLTAIDLGGGRITGANYNSTTPLAQQMEKLPLSLGADPSEGDLYAALRGAEVEVTGSGPVFRGRILSLEVRDAAEGEPPQARALPERLLLTVVADSGATRTLELTPTTVVRVLDGGLRTDLNTYLQLLDRNRTEGLRHLTLTDLGTGTRELRVSYLSEVPVWKSTYRLLLTGGGATPAKTATLQGYSVVDNTTGEDWSGVQLTLIAGSPQSFVQPLAEPIYDRRPEVPIAENAQLTPQLHDSGVGGESGTAQAFLSSSSGGNPTSLFGSPTGTGDGPAVSVRNRGIEPGSSSGMGGRVYSVNGSLADRAMPAIPYEMAARQSVVPNTTTKAFDDFFSYTIAEPVTIPRNGSALVPTLQVQVPVESVTLWSAGEGRPLRALWMTNSSQLTLDRGSFSVVEDGGFAGQGLLDPIHPGERRLLSYAADEAVRVVTDATRNTRRLRTVSVDKGVLRAANEEAAAVGYTVANAAPEPRTVIVEEARRPGWTLEADPKPAETTPTVYRFRVEVAAGGSATLKVEQRRTVDEFFRLADTNESQLTVYLRDNKADPAVLAQLEPVFAAQRAVAALDAQISAQKDKIRTTEEDGRRVRENLAVLKGSSEERALARRYTGELNAEEDTLAALRKELANLQQRRDTAAATLSDRIGALRIGGDGQ